MSNQDDPDFLNFEPSEKDSELLVQKNVNWEYIDLINIVSNMQPDLAKTTEKVASGVEMQKEFSELFIYVQAMSSYAFNLSAEIKKTKEVDIGLHGMSQLHADFMATVRNIKSPKAFFNNKNNSEAAVQFVKYMKGYMESFEASIAIFEPIVLEFDLSDMSSDCYDHINLALRNIKNCRDIAKLLVAYMTPEK
jgi:hypothetical protein